MQPHNDQALFDWIRSGREQLGNRRTPDWAGNLVSHLVPPLFEAYAKILHRVEAHYENIDSPLSQAEISILGIPPCEPLKSFIEDGAFCYAVLQGMPMRQVLEFSNAMAALNCTA